MGKLFRGYLLACGLLANIALVGGGLVVAAVGLDELRAAARDGVPGMARLAATTVHRVEVWRAERAARALGLAAARDAGTAATLDLPLDPGLGGGRVLAVGPTRAYRKPSAAAAIARAGDIVELDAGDYHGDSVIWRTDDLVIRAVGGRAHVHGSGLALVQDKALWLVQGRNVRIENIEFSGARSRDRNGAGIRAEGDRLHVIGCFFHDNETGILSNPVAGGSLLIEYSEFARNGHADGQAHQIYVNAMQRFELRYSYVHDSVIGSAIKSRASINRIAYNRIVDGANGTSNYTLDLSDGGVALIVGNVLEQGPRTGNRAIVAYATESAGNQPQQLFLVHNTLVNDRHAGAFVLNASHGEANLYNNLLLGPGTPLRGPALAVGNVVVRDGWMAWGDDTLGGVAGSGGNRVVRGRAVADRAALDYRLREGSPAIDAGAALENTDEFELVPAAEFDPPFVVRERKVQGAPDAGAFEAP